MPGRRIPDLIVDAETSKRMAKTRQHGTAPELVVRSIARRLGLHFRVRNRDLPGSPDLANRSRLWAVFVHGCYWHRHTGCKKTTTPTRNREFWEAKFVANVRRDRRAVHALRQRGFRVVVIWECETLTPTRVERRLARLLTGREPSGAALRKRGGHAG